MLIDKTLYISFINLKSYNKNYFEIMNKSFNKYL